MTVAWQNTILFIWLSNRNFLVFLFIVSYIRKYNTYLAAHIKFLRLFALARRRARPYLAETQEFLQFFAVQLVSAAHLGVNFLIVE